MKKQIYGSSPEFKESIENIAPETKILELSDFNNDQLEKITSLAKTIKEIHLIHCSQLTSFTGIVQLLKNSSLVNTFMMSFCQLTSLAGLIIPKTVTELRIGFCENLNSLEGLVVQEDIYISLIGFKVTLLEKLKIPHVNKLRISSFDYLESYSWVMPNNLITLEICNCKSIDSLDFKAVKLKSLVVSQCNNLRSLSKSKLQTPELTNIKVSDCENFASFDLTDSKVTNIEIYDCSKISSLAGFYPELKNLVVSDCENFVSFFDLIALKLSNIDLTNCYKLSLDLCKKNFKNNYILTKLFIGTDIDINTYTEIVQRNIKCLENVAKTFPELTIDVLLNDFLYKCDKKKLINILSKNVNQKMNFDTEQNIIAFVEKKQQSLNDLLIPYLQNIDIIGCVFDYFKVKDNNYESFFSEDQ